MEEPATGIIGDKLQAQRLAGNCIGGMLQRGKARIDPLDEQAKEMTMQVHGVPHGRLVLGKPTKTSSPGAMMRGSASGRA